MAPQIERPRLKLTQNQLHSAANDNGYDTLTALFGRGFVQHSAPVLLDEGTAPEPDLAVLKQHRRAYTENPSIGECLLVVEVSDTTLSYDKTTKAELYARAGVPEYWIVNLNARTLIVHRSPSDDGFGELRTLSETESIAPLAKPESPVAVKDMLP